MSVFFSLAALITALLFVLTTRLEILKGAPNNFTFGFYVAAKFVVGYLWGVFIFNIVLLDTTFLAYIKSLAIFIAAAMIWESTWSISKSKKNFAVYYFLPGVCTAAAFLILVIFYPMTIADQKFNAANGSLSKEKNLEATDEKHLPVVGDDYAEYVAKRELSTWKKNISYFELGYGIKQSINGTLYYVYPIEYRGYSKWLKGQPVPGFIKVNAENPNAEAEFVKSDMRYVPSAYFNDNVSRMVRKKNPTTLLMDPSFEIDDQNHPFYVVPYGHFEALRNIRIVDGAILVDPKTGEQKKYETKDVPKFVDQIIPTDIAFERMQWYGEYREGGWFNANGLLGTGILASQTGVVEPTDWGDADSVFGLYDKANQLSWFSDFTNPTSDSDTMVGFAMMNARNGKIDYYENVSGVSGSDAKGVSQKGTLKAEDLKGNVRGLFQIYGQPTWLVSLEDKSGVYRYTAFVNVKDAQVYAYAKDVNEALNNYETAIATGMTGQNASASKDAKESVISGSVVSVYKREVKDKTMVQFLLDNSDKIFTVTASEYPYAMFIETGHRLNLTYIDTKNINVSVKSLKDITLKK
ncbi:hypothetical protein RCG23_25525 [Neobacillus sp. PS3-34]|uniref:hypothetical protein n=1 Tax=Neobacillus sp. PS3-34 TaxID=3070678 RepID=UPI0027E05113|nr:hypothetical protein [Neobacillus sp. PS3-34]WML48539.1 hypothetical protein RCG23_25525 [Neobacillus sp. PS3-34]